MRKTIFLLFFGFNIGVNYSVNAQEIKITSNLDTNSILIGQQTFYNLKITTPIGFKFEIQTSKDTLTDKIEIIDYKIDTILKANSQTISFHYLITSFDSGYYAIPPTFLKYDIINDTNYSTVKTDTLFLSVGSIPVDLKGEIKDIKDILEEPYTLLEIFTRFVLPILLLLLVIGILFFIYQRRKKRQPIFKRSEKPLLPPNIEAVEALKKLKSDKLWQKNETKEYYSRLTDIIRRYIERRFDFPAQEMVSSEIVGSLKSCQVKTEEIEKLSWNLESSDLVKFAKHQPLADENERIINWAFDFVENTKKENTKEEEVKL